MLIASAGVQKDKSLRKIKLLLFKVHFNAGSNYILQTEDVLKTEDVVETEDVLKTLHRQ